MKNSDNLDAKQLLEVPLRYFAFWNTQGHFLFVGNALRGEPLVLIQNSFTDLTIKLIGQSDAHKN